MKRLLPLLVLASLAGCAQPAQPFATPADHPGNPDAPLAAVHTGEAAAPEAHPVHDHATHTHAAPAPGGAYACPMHPEMTSNDPATRCPICGMKETAKVNKEKPQ